MQSVQQTNLRVILFFAPQPTLNQFTNKGGQQQKPKPYPLTYITKSSAFSTTAPLDSVATPSGYELTYGPTSGANNAPGYMGFNFLTQYDPAACAKLCNANAGCASFNIWRGVVNGDPRTYTCSMYRSVVDQSTAVNYGDDVNKVKVTYSRGYKNTAVASALAQCQSSGASQGVAWTRIPRSDANQYVCAANGGGDVTNLPALSTATDSGLTTNALRASGTTESEAFYPYGSSNSVNAGDFSMLHKFYFRAPTTGTYTFTVNAADDVVRAWFGDKAKKGWTASNSDILATCGSNGGAGSFQMKLDAGSYTPARLTWLQGNGPYGYSFTVTDPQGNTLDSSNYFQYACDQTVSAFSF